MPDDTLPYATPHPKRWTDRGQRWFSRRASTSGHRLIALAVMAFVGAVCCTQSQNNFQIYNQGQTVLNVAVILFAVEYVLSFFQ